MEALTTTSKEIFSPKRHRQSYEPETDILSNLPDVLLVDILSLLQLKDSVRTSVLSKRWTHLWRQIHCINFCYLSSCKPTPSQAFEAFDKVLLDLAHSRNIKQFYVQFKSTVFDSTSRYSLVDSWVNWAVQRNVKMLGLDIEITAYNDRTFYQVPLVLFQCHFFVQLELSNSGLNLQNVPVSWPLLKALFLKNMLFNALDFNTLLISCPLLERLSIVKCVFGISDEPCSEIRICSSTLRCLRLWECKHKYDYKVVFCLPHLVRVSINMLMYHNGTEQRAALEALIFVEGVHVGDRCAQAFSVKGINYTASVKHLWVEISLENRRYLSGMASLLSCYSNIQTLDIEFIRERRVRGVSCINVLEECLSRLLLLKTVHVYGITDFEVMVLSGHKSVEFYTKHEGCVSGKMKADVLRALLGFSNRLEELSVTVDTYKSSTHFISESFMIESMMNLLQNFKKASPLICIKVFCEVAESIYWGGGVGGRYPLRKRLEI